MIESLIPENTFFSRASFELIERVEQLRVRASLRQSQEQKAYLGQFLTPVPVAQLMVSMLNCQTSTVHMLDAGAGMGSLFATAVAALCERQIPPKEICITAYEIDDSMGEYLHEIMHLCQMRCKQNGIEFKGEIRQTDFIESGLDLLNQTLFSSYSQPSFNCAILNPPYRKLASNSAIYQQLKLAGLETTNLYTAFLAIAMHLLEPGGELVAITPRSFCNGPYFQKFRKSLLKTLTLRHLHLFVSRHTTFQHDNVLQENIVLHAVKETGREKNIVITSSRGTEDEWISSHEVRYEQVVNPEDTHSFIRLIPDEPGQRVAQRMAHFHTSLTDLGLSVSTGRVVEFRAQLFLRTQPEQGTVPLIFPTHFEHGYISWPRQLSRKPNALQLHEQTYSLLVPNENYVLIKRFSSVEEKRRLVAAIYDKTCVPGEYVGFENHLNYFHQNGSGLDISVARGLAAFLNSTLVDLYFRQFNGHTQVNATDLRSLKYPTLEELKILGEHIQEQFLTQCEIDTLIEMELLNMAGKEIQEDDPILIKSRIEEALSILKALGLPRGQLNERSALTLLALLDLTPGKPWVEASNPLCGITPMMDFFAKQYGKSYKPNTRETVRRQTVHQFLDAGIIVENPDDPERPPNSPKAVYQIESGALQLLRTFGTSQWEKHLKAYLASIETLKQRYAQERAMKQIPVTITPGTTIMLSPGGQNVLVEKIINEFAPRFTPGAEIVYVGDTANKFAYFHKEKLETLGVEIEAHGKIPDVIIHYPEKNWLVFIEAVTSHGPINPKRMTELKTLFHSATIGLVFVTAFLSRKAMSQYLNEISWETDVWVAESPTHLIHFNGERFLGPY